MLEIMNFTEAIVISSIETPIVLTYTKYSPILLKEVLDYHSNQLRLNTANVKTKNELSFSGRKKFRQKGTGRARAGNLKQSQHVGGVKLFGPNGRIYNTSIPNKKIKKGLSIALSNLYNNNDLIVVKNFELSSHKTKNLIESLNKHSIDKCLLIDVEINKNLMLASSNIFNVKFCLSKDINALKLIRSKKVIITEKALVQLNDRLKDEVNNKEKING